MLNSHLAPLSTPKAILYSSMEHGSAAAPAASKLTGHTSSACCCALSKDAALLASGGEDGRICLHDLGSRKLLQALELDSSEATSAVAWNPQKPHMLYAANAGCISTVDIRQMETPVTRLQVSQEEVGCMDVNRPGKFLAAGDDDGQLHIVDLSSGKLLRSIKQAHSNICSSVRFRAHKPRELLTGGMDCRVTKQDFSRGRCLDAWSMHEEHQQQQGVQQKMFNPPLVHCIAVPDTEELPDRSLVAAARGDGMVAVFDVDNEQPQSTFAVAARASSSAAGLSRAAIGCSVLLGAEDGGHNRPACAVQFAPSTSGRLLLSGGEDKKLVLWDWSAKLCGATAEQGTDFGAAAAGEAQHCISWHQAHRFKVNALECRAAGAGLEVFVCDLSKAITSLMIPG